MKSFSIIIVLTFLISAPSCLKKSPAEQVQHKQNRVTPNSVSPQRNNIERHPQTSHPSTNTTNQLTFPAGDPTSDYSYRIIPAQGGTFGYEILKASRPMIRQTTIPGMPGKAGFTNEADAQKVAEAVLNKMKNGEMPPTVSEKELKEMNVLK